MHHEFPPTDAPDPADPDVQFGAAPEQVTTELLELCEQFLRQASPIVHTELSDFSPKWLPPWQSRLVPRHPGLNHPSEPHRLEANSPGAVSR